MALPAFFSRVTDALRPVADIDATALADKLKNTTVRIEHGATDPGSRPAFLLAVNLCARLYPSLSLQADPDLLREAGHLAHQINPLIDLDVEESASSGESADVAATPQRTARVLCLLVGTPQGHPIDPTPRTETAKAGSGSGAQPIESAGESVRVDAAGWNAAIDADAEWLTEAAKLKQTSPLAWLVAAALGVGELFRAAFAEELGSRGRRGTQPGGFNLVTGNDFDALPFEDTLVDLGRIHLAGAGAVGQACILGLRHARVMGELQVVDPDSVTLANLQRYVLATQQSEGELKTTIAQRALQGTALAVDTLTGRWGDDRGHLHVDTVMVALDTARDRIAVASTLARQVYNAWTQVADLGWSRHERFGDEPCLACLYWPTRRRPSDHELIAASLGQPELRVLGYLVFAIPIGYPLPGVPNIPSLPAGPDSGRWTQTSLLDDLVASGVVPPDAATDWGSRPIAEVYRDGVCAGGLLPAGDVPGEVLVPLAHQSAIAGLMLATSVVIARDPQLRDARGDCTEFRYDVLRGFPQVLQRPRARTANCLCADADYQAAALELSQT